MENKNNVSDAVIRVKGLKKDFENLSVLKGVDVDIRKGDAIEQTWIFEIPRNFLYGDYDVRVEWFGSEQTFEKVNFSKAK